MEFFLLDNIFNGALEGKAISLKGNNSEQTQINGKFLVNSIDNNRGKIYLVNDEGVFSSLHYTDFTHKNNPVKLVILK